MDTSPLRVLLLLSFSSAFGGAVNITVRLEENITLTCGLNSSSIMAWYRLTADKMTLLIFAQRGKLLSGGLVIEHNEDPSRFDLQADPELESLKLVVTGLKETDLGLYYCTAGDTYKDMKFSTAIRLTFAESASDGVGYWTLCISACFICGICGFLCALVLCYSRGSFATSCISRVKENSNIQAAQVHYSSLRFISRSRTPPTPPVNVTYATIAKHTP